MKRFNWFDSIRTSVNFLMNEFMSTLRADS
jgi:hypothetical protein